VEEGEDTEHNELGVVLFSDAIVEPLAVVVEA
jgi:hypothetical protein